MSLVFIVLLMATAAALYFVPVAGLLSIARLIARQVQRIRAYQRARPALGDAGHRLQLRATRSSLVFGDEIRGSIAGFEIAIDQHYRARVRGLRKGPFGSLRVKVTSPVDLPHRLAFFSRDGERPEGAPPGDPLRTYDPAFDCAFLTFGRLAGVTARLDASIRRRMIELDVKVELDAHANTLIAVTRQPLFLPQTIVRLVEQLVALAQDLTADGPDVPALLFANAVSDPEVAVRYQNLDLILRDFPSTPQAKDALRIAWEAPERGIRYLAAIRMGNEGINFLEETATLSEEPIALRVMSLRHLARHAPRERVLPLLHTTLRSRAPKLREAVIELLGRLQDKNAVPRLVSIGSSFAVPETRVAIANALGSIGDTRAESFLLQLLEEDDLELKIAAASALGKAGTALSLRPLAKIASRYTGIRDLWRAANISISRIEIRLGPMERGQLSLVSGGGMEGALSVPGGEAGAISVADDPGDLSHPSDPAAASARDPAA